VDPTDAESAAAADDPVAVCVVDGVEEVAAEDPEAFAAVAAGDPGVLDAAVGEAMESAEDPGESSAWASRSSRWRGDRAETASSSVICWTRSTRAGSGAGGATTPAGGGDVADAGSPRRGSRVVTVGRAARDCRASR
jgi:hypothetical protein